MDQGNLKSYITGFITSIVLTLAAYFVVIRPTIFGSASTTLIVILGFAVLQLIVQLIFFLHLAQQPGRRWKLTVFFSTLALVLLIIVGSIWIMEHLNYNMTPEQQVQYINDQQGGF